MVCKNCGSELEENQKVCSNCGYSDEDIDKIKITYDDENEEYVDPPVIVEAHTFIDEESFAKKVNESKLQKETTDDFIEENNKKGIIFYLLIVLALIVIGLVCYFLIVPNIGHKSNKVQIEENMFSSEDWTSGEFMIDGDFYKLKDEFNKLYDKNWNIEDDKYSIDTKIKASEITDDIKITNSFNKDVKVKIKLKNGTDKDQVLKNCYIYSISIDNTDLDKPLDFTLPGNIIMGSKELEIKSLYGQLDESDIIVDNVSNSVVYQYKDNSKHLDLTIYENGGLKSFVYYLDEGK